MKTIAAHTFEVDDTDLAIEQIQAQLGSFDDLGANTIGIISCHCEFVLSGTMRAICDMLPFEIVGTVSTSQSIGAQPGSLLLTLMVISCDDVRFAIGITDPLNDDPRGAIRECYKQTAARSTDEPALIFMFAPTMPHNSGDDYVAAINEASNGIPCFGTLAIEPTGNFDHSYSIANGMHFIDRIVTVLAYGDIVPRFFCATLSEDRIIGSSAVITKSDRHLLMEINGKPIAQYFEDLGLTKASETPFGMALLPFMLDYNDGTPMVSKTMLSLTPEKYALCAGSVPEGSTMFIATADKADVMQTSAAAMDEAMEYISTSAADGSRKGPHALLVYSCAGRGITLGADQYAEMLLVHDKVAGKIPFMMSCTGGEICPIYDAAGKPLNRFQNNALILCVL